MQDNKKAILKQAIRSILVPLSRFMLSHGLTYDEFNQISKKAFFAAGTDLLEKSGQPLNMSKLSILTGLHRRDVANFTKAPPAAAEETPYKNAAASIVAKWISDPAYLDTQQQPRTLAYTAAPGHPPGFSDLVAAVSKDIRPKAYMEELLRLNIIGQHEDGTLHLRKEAFIPSDSFVEKLRFFVRNTRDHLHASISNMDGNGEPFFDRTAFRANLTADDIHALSAALDKEGMSLLKSIYQKAEILSAVPRDDKDKTHRMTVGIYMYHEEQNRDDQK